MSMIAFFHVLCCFSSISLSVDSSDAGLFGVTSSRAGVCCDVTLRSSSSEVSNSLATGGSREGQKDNLTFAYQSALNTLADLLDIELDENNRNRKTFNNN